VQCEAANLPTHRDHLEAQPDDRKPKRPGGASGQPRALLEAPPAGTLKGKRDRAILATFLHHGLRCEELCALRVRDLQNRQGVPHLRVFGKGAKIR
jgi:site-specific recombinase XerD